MCHGAATEKAYYRGRRAYCTAQRSDTNPYNRDTQKEDYREWRDGWIDQYADEVLGERERA